MAQHHNLAFSPDFLARGRALAERRLAYLTELYDSGRWTRYFSDHDFLDNACAAREAVETWCRLEQPSLYDLDASLSLPIAPDAAATLVPSDVEDDSAVEQDWHQDYWLPPISFSTDGVGAERDLNEV